MTRSSSPPAGQGASALVGKVLSGRWHVDRLIGAGGMAAVYAATHRNGRRVAIKVLKPELAANARLRRRFLREGYLANRVGHAGAVAVFDDDQTDEGAFLVMELLRGATLESLCQKQGGKLPVGDVCWAGVRALEVLAAAHASGVVHRDVKPSNLFFAAEGSLKLLDFGIASLREMADFSTLTQGGAALGTPGYMAPEQARGKWQDLSTATDIWGVGATMFRLLSGRLVHREETASETIIATATTPAPGLASVCPDVPAGVAAVVDRALQIAPEARWPDALAMRDVLAELARTLPAPSVFCASHGESFLTMEEDGPASLLEPGSSLEASFATAPATMRTAPRTLLLAVVGLLVVGGGVFTFDRWRATKASSIGGSPSSESVDEPSREIAAPRSRSTSPSARSASSVAGGEVVSRAKKQELKVRANDGGADSLEAAPGEASSRAAQATRAAGARAPSAAATPERARAAPRPAPESGLRKPWHNELLMERK